MTQNNAASIFKKSSKTYFYSSLFFPKKVRDQVFILYAFVRLADDFVDKVKPNKTAYYSLKLAYQQALAGHLVNSLTAANFAALVKKVNLDQAWVNAFFDSMEMDLASARYGTYADLYQYIYGSAEVIGLMMAKIMGLPEKAFHSAQMLGRAMQYINMIRDLDEDNKLHRAYFPNEIIKHYHLDSLKYSFVKNNLADFKRFIRDQITLYRSWQQEAETGFQYIPRRYLIPIKTASEMYKWTARVIYEDPLIIYSKKVKPTKFKVLGQVFINAVTLK